FTGLLVVLLSIVIWASNHAYLSITATGTSGDTNYKLVNSGDGTITEFKSKEKSIKRLVAKGSYEIYVQKDTASFITTAKAGSFLETTSVTGTLVSEQDREFVGYNPSPCSYYNSETLYSFECDGALESVSTHTPATNILPTLVEKSGLKSTSAINGVAYTAFGPVIFTDPVYVTEEIVSADYTVGLLSPDMRTLSPRSLNFLAFGEDYEIKAYLNGFIIYSSDLDEIYYFSSLEAYPKKLEVTVPKDSSQQAIGLNVNGSTIIRYYSNNPGGEIEAETEGDAEPAASEIYLMSESSNVRFTTSDLILGASGCFEKKLCALTSEGFLKVYTIGAKSLDFEFQYREVKQLHQINNVPLAVTTQGILSLAGESGKSFYVYTFGGYTYCGLEPAADGTIVCLIDSEQRKTALHLISTRTVSVAYDKQISKLIKSDLINDLSAYKNILFVTPRLNKPGSLESQVEGLYSAQQIQASNDNLSEALRASGISSQDYKVINTLNPF
ncbi:MAG: hypothetical protein JWQ44_2982, partial [Chthoniobacter sp.]|nr:hypothetical protein [Chthoniobacter sp.]